MTGQIHYTPLELYPGYGVIQCTVPHSLRQAILDSIDNASVPANPGLVGQIKDEKNLYLHKNNLHYREFIFSVTKTYEDHFTSWSSNIAFLNSHSKLELEHDTLWVNRMNKGEFNPAHIHSAVYSYVMWIKIPYDMEEESKVFPESKDNACGCFDFLYNSNTGVSNYRIYADRRYEWEMIFFPSNLTHTVYPYFTSDEQRISVAGNIKISDNK